MSIDEAKEELSRMKGHHYFAHGDEATVKEGIACNLACKVMDKFQVIRDILDECYEGYITDLEANKRIKDIIEEFDFM